MVLPTQHNDMYTIIAQFWRQMNGSSGKCGFIKITLRTRPHSLWIGAGLTLFGAQT